ncbi:MAG: hypothetical protein ACPGWR_10940 [Ardenticatenaceae bacterium]
MSNLNLPNCRFFHYDAFRGREIMRCRFLEQTGEHGTWSVRLCGSCPVPDVLAETTCEEVLLEGHVESSLFGLVSQVEISFAACAVAKRPLSDPKDCPACAKPAIDVEVNEEFNNDPLYTKNKPAKENGLMDALRRVPIAVWLVAGLIVAAILIPSYGFLLNRFLLSVVLLLRVFIRFILAGLFLGCTGYCLLRLARR